MAAPVPEVFGRRDPWTEAAIPFGLEVLEAINVRVGAVTLDLAALAAATRPPS